MLKPLRSYRSKQPKFKKGSLGFLFFVCYKLNKRKNQTRKPGFKNIALELLLFIASENYILNV